VREQAAQAAAVAGAIVHRSVDSFFTSLSFHREQANKPKSPHAARSAFSMTNRLELKVQTSSDPLPIA